MLRARLLFALGQAFLMASAACAANLVYPLLLSTGWNLMGNSLTTSLDVKATFGTQSNVTTVWKWNAASSSWAFYAPALDANGTLATYAAGKGYTVLTSINPGEGYWVNAAGLLLMDDQSGSGVALTAGNLGTGWNLVATGDDVTPNYLADTLANVVTQWAWDNATSTWFFHAPSLVENDTLSTYIASKGYKEFGALTLGNGRGFWVNIADRWQTVSNANGTCQVAAPPAWVQGRDFTLELGVARKIDLDSGILTAAGMGADWDIDDLPGGPAPVFATPGTRYQLRSYRTDGDAVCSVWRIKEGTAFTDAEKALFRKVGNTLRLAP